MAKSMLPLMTWCDKRLQELVVALEGGSRHRVVPMGSYAYAVAQLADHVAPHGWEVVSVWVNQGGDTKMLFRWRPQ